MTLTEDKTLIDMIETKIEEEIIASINAEIEIIESERPADDTKNNETSRKGFRITEFDTPRDREMAVFTHAKKLSEYIFVITEKSPVKLRWNITSRLLNTSVDIIESLYRANFERGIERVEWQKKAMVSLNILDFYAETAKTKQAITFRQMEIIARQISEVKKMLSGWVRSTKRKDAKQAECEAMNAAKSKKIEQVNI